MLNPQAMYDAQQQAAGFVLPQFYNIESTVYQRKYPSFEYEQFMPVVTAGSEWARGTTFFSGDIAGMANWLSGYGFDMPYASVSREQFLRAFHLAGVGYEWNLEEISTAMLEGRNMTAEKADAARQVAQQFLWNIAMTGRNPGAAASEKGWTGLLNDPNVPAADVPANGTGNVTWWAAKTPDQILDDINAALDLVVTQSLETEMADTVLLPSSQFRLLGQRPRSSTSDTTILAFLRAHNVYTEQTGRPLNIRGLRNLETADPGGDGRMIVYRNDPQVLRFHLPMPHRFLEPFRKGSMTWEVAGIMRTGGTEIRLPKAMVYRDGIVDN